MNPARCPRNPKQAVAYLLKSGHEEGRVTDEEVAECMELFNGGPTSPWVEARVTELLDKCRTPPADPETVGFVNVDLCGRTPCAAAVEFWRELLEEAIAVTEETEAEMEASYLAALDAMKLVHHGAFFNAEMASIGSDARGWIGFVAAGARMCRSADTFRSSDDSGAWCRSIIEREGGRQ